jgi:hypothetical protein
MSEYYTHLLIPASATYCPSPDSVSRFLEDVIQLRAVADNSEVQFAKVERVTPSVRESRNPVTGATMTIQEPSRKRAKPRRLSKTSQIVRLARNVDEYDVSVVSEGLPEVPPLDVGYMEGGVWKPMGDPYYLEVACHVRAQTVRLSILDSAEEMHKRPDLSNLDLAVRFGEDCPANDSVGFFVHPESSEAIRVGNAGCGMFWIEFEYGKSIFPRLHENNLRLLKPEIENLAAETFQTEFVQGCLWG